MQNRFLFQILSFLFLIPFSIKAQDEVPNISYVGAPKKYEIAEITVSGVQNYDPAILVNLSGLRVGQVIQVPGDDITNSIKKYWDHGLFSDVKIIAKRIEGRQIYLEIMLSERPRLSDIRYFGLRKSEIETVSEKVAMMKGSQVTPYLVSRAEKYIKDYFVDKGFSNTEVKIFQRDDTTAVNQVIMEVTVDKKDKVKVNTLTFEGNEVMSDFECGWVMKKTNALGKIYNFFRTKKFIPEKYQEDLVALIDAYNEKGYRDAYIVYDSISHREDNTVDIKIKVSEGRKYYFGNITWVGNSIYPGDYLSEVFRVKKGDVYNQKQLDKRLRDDEDAVQNQYMDQGYLFSSITPTEVNVEGDTIDLEMRVYEGPQATINNVIIKGNTKTHEHVARREVRTKPGQLFSKTELVRTVRELAQLGYFNPEKISPDVQPNQEDGTVDLTYILEEKANDQIELSGGWGAGMFVGSLGLKFSNFSVRNIFDPEAWRPLPTGDGQTLSLRAQTNGRYYQSYSASFVEPWFGGKRPNSLSLSIYYTKQTDVSSRAGYGYGGMSYSGGNTGRYMKVFGASVGHGRRLSWPDDWFQLYTEIAYQLYSVKDWNMMTIQNGNSNSLSLGLTLTRNSIDNPLYTRNGSTFSIGLNITPPWSIINNTDTKKLSNIIDNENKVFSDDAVDEASQELYRFIEFHKWTFKDAIFKSLDSRQKLVAMGKIEGGFLGYYDEYARSPYEKYLMGGDGMSGFAMYGTQTVGLRGYENTSLTPLDDKGNYNGNLYTKMSFELRYPITLQPSATVYALGFLESGNAWSEFKDYNPFQMYRSAGVGLRIFLPIFGLMGIDWGYGFDEVPGRPTANGSNFHFVIGQSF